MCVQSMVSTIRKQRIRIRELEGVNTQDDGKNEETESLACKASACAVARDAATYINGRLRGLDEYIHEKEIEKRNKEFHIQALKAVLRARAVASTAAAASRQTILGLGDILELYQMLNVMKKKKTQGNDIQEKEEEIRKLRTQLKEFEKQETEKVPTKEEKNKLPPSSSSFLGNAGAYALVALASGVLTALIQKFITKV